MMGNTATERCYVLSSQWVALTLAPRFWDEPVCVGGGGGGRLALAPLRWYVSVYLKQSVR